VQFLAGGTQLLDLMKLGTMQPDRLVDINGLPLAGIDLGPQGLRLGALTRMSDVERHAAIRREYPVIAETMALAASQQIRNMASLAGNVLQRTRCQYFRDPSWAACNKRDPGSGCAALGGVNRKHAVLGTSERCISAYPGDFAQALVALGAEAQTTGERGNRLIPVEQLHTGPDDPHRETVLAPGELITAFLIPAGPWTRRSVYVKVRDRESYAFALASAAVALDLRQGIVQEARIGLGGVAYKPWRAHAAEQALHGKRLDEGAAAEAARAAFAGARSSGENGYKVELGQRTLVRALLQAARMEA
jgi:xanthine dehydrogenase YagS FAD-binding subunit